MITSAKKIFLDFETIQFFSHRKIFFLAQEFFLAVRKKFLLQEKKCGKKEYHKNKKKFLGISVRVVHPNYT